MKIYIKEPLIQDVGEYKIYAIEEKHGKIFAAKQSIDIKFLELVEIKEHEEPPYLYKIPHSIFLPMIKEMILFANKQNIKTDNESVLEGKLIATEKHLEDMRTHFATVLNIITKD